MPVGPLIELVSERDSAQVAALQQLAGNVVSLWNVSYRAVSNFAQEHNLCTLASTISGKAANQKLTFHMSKAGDLCTSLYLQVNVPGIQATNAIASYIWGLGYGMIQYASFHLSNHSQEDIPGWYMEVAEELHQPAGRRLEEAVFKFDRVTLPELAALSGKAFTMYVPIPFWFTKGAHAALPLLSMNCFDLDVIIVLKGIKDIAFALSDTCISTHQSSTPVNVTTDGTNALTWSDFSFSLWAGSVYLDVEERNYFASTEHEYLMKSVHTYTSYAQEAGYPFGSQQQLSLVNIPFNHPISSLIWFVGDAAARPGNWGTYEPDQGAGTDADANEGVPFVGGVRGLFGKVASARAAITPANGKTDFNVLRAGVKDVATLTGGGIVLSSSGVKEWRKDGLNGCLHLPGNIHDYRMADSSGEEIEPLERVTLQFNSTDRWSNDLDPTYFRMVQQQEHFANVARKGIYTWSFAANASSPFPNGTCNFSRIDDITMTFTKNSDHTQSTDEGIGSSAELFLAAEHFQIYVVKKGSSGRKFGN